MSFESLEDRILQETKRLDIKAASLKHEAEILNSVANEMIEQSENLKAIVKNYKEEPV